MARHRPKPHMTRKRRRRAEIEAIAERIARERSFSCVINPFDAPIMPYETLDVERVVAQFEVEQWLIDHRGEEVTDEYRRRACEKLGRELDEQGYLTTKTTDNSLSGMREVALILRVCKARK